MPKGTGRAPLPGEPGAGTKGAGNVEEMPPDAPPPHPGAPSEAHRLPRTATPSRYDLTIDVDLERARFTGTAAIALELAEAVDSITLNAAELSIEDASLEPAGASPLSASVALEEAAERAVFTLERRVGPGPAVLRCAFAGTLNDKLRGLYRSTFVDADGVTRTIATSQMEATDARRAFPCFDEPDRKAVFAITLVLDEGLQAYSNSPIATEEPAGPGHKAVRFEPTMVMSSYLVALIVGPFEATEPAEVDGVPVRVVHVPGKGHLAPYAIEVADHALSYFADYFAIPYPGQKLDLVAVPDFAFGAMENLGCVTFRETALLVDREAAARGDLERVADVVAHELAHMWFGDLVTMGWWEGIWLNEAFATFMATKCIAAFRPEWDRWVSFGLEREAALAVDALHTTRPIEYPVGSPEEAQGMFDVLTYQKGGSVLLMLEQYLGEEVFREGIRRYLAAHAYANTVTSDLWDALEEVSGKPVRAVADSWILQGGHPVVTLKDSTLGQRPFAYREGEGESAIGTRWSVPIHLRSLADGQSATVLLDQASAPLPELAGPVLVNAGGYGVYRTGYDDDQLQVLAGRIRELAPLERTNLLADTWALVLAGETPLARLFDLAAGLFEETEPTTFAPVVAALGLCSRAADESSRDALAEATRSLLGPRFATLGWEPAEGEGERIPNLRALLIATLGTIGKDEAVRAEAARRFDAAMAGGPRLDANLEAAVLEVVADQNRPADYEAFYARYKEGATPQEELRYLSALATFPDAALATRTFELALGEVRTQNGPLLIAGLLTNPVGGPAVFEELAKRFEQALARFPDNTHARMLSGVRLLCSDLAVAERVRGFFAEHRLHSGQRTLEQTLERLSINVSFVERERPELGTTLHRAAG
jgi:puromycin-sensitive aminopeptidase